MGEELVNVQIDVKNFGPIEKASVDLRPLTVFVGESNTGKTYLAALIYALHQHFEGFSQLPYPYSAAKYLTFFYGSQRNYSPGMRNEVEQIKLEMLKKLNIPGRSLKLSDFTEQLFTEIESIFTEQEEFTEQENFPNELLRCFDLESVSKLIRFTGNGDNELDISLTVREGDQKCWDFEMQSASSSDPTITGFINPDIILIDTNDPIRKSEFNEISDVERLFQTLVTRWWRTGNSYYLPAARSGIMQSHRSIATSLIKKATRIGLDRFPEVTTFSGMIADFLEQIIRYGEQRTSSAEIEDIAKRLEDELLEGKIEIDRPISEGYPEFLYRPEQAEAGLRMSHSAAMVSELAPLVLFLRGVIKQGDMLIIEEPESHLHPGAQTKIAQTLARLVRAGVHVLITTHSNYLLQQIGNLIREGELRKLGESTSDSADYLQAEEVGTWWFHKNKPVEELPFKLVEGIEPEDHWDIAEDLYNQSAGLQNRIVQTKGSNAVESE